MAQRFDRAMMRIKRATADGRIVFDMNCIVYGEFDPGYPAPPCSNPDSPAFSDPGCPEELEVHGTHEVDDIYIEGPDGEEADFSHLSSENRTLVKMIDHARDKEAEQLAKVFELKKDGKLAKIDELTKCAREHGILGQFLEELLACRLGIGPWSSIDVTAEEVEASYGSLVEQLESREDFW